jgi:Ca2+-binding RTX toxin-like protein
VLKGGLGNDVLRGQTGLDSFQFETALGATNVDQVIDFSVADDSIVLENAVFTGLAAGALAPGAFRTGAAAADADDRIVYNSATGALLFDADGLGGAAAIQFATLSTGLALTASDFTVI